MRSDDDWRNRIVTDGHDRTAWLLARKYYLTASDVPAVLGLDRKSAAAVLRDKLDPELGPELRMAQIAAGRHLESGILDWYLDDHLDGELHRTPVLVHSPEAAWLGASPDAVLDGEPIEVKCVMWVSRPNWHTHTRTVKGWPKGFDLPVAVARDVITPPVPARPRDAEGPGPLWRAATRHMLTDLLPGMGAPEAPLKYWVQLQVQLHVLGATVGHIVALQGGTTRYDLTYAVDPSFQAWMLERLHAFRTQWTERL